MMQFAKICFSKLILLYLWIAKILLAKDHFKVNFFTRLRYNLRGYLADQYVLYDFAHCDWREYLSEFDWYRSRAINGDYSFILNNKPVCSDILKQYVRVPQTYALKMGRRITLSDGKAATDTVLLELLREKKISIVKPISRGKGLNIFLIAYQSGGFSCNGRPISEQALLRLLNKKKEWFLSEYIHQADYLNKIYDKTANTIRLITLRDPGTQRFKSFFAVQRLGTKQTEPVDNGSQGGLIAKIHMETGALSHARSLHNTNVYVQHPDSLAPIEGVIIPNWKQLQQELVQVAEHFPYLSFIAWDILVTDDGYCVIEANASSGVNIIQLWGGQRNGELGDFFRSHRVIR